MTSFSDTSHQLYLDSAYDHASVDRHIPNPPIHPAPGRQAVSETGSQRISLVSRLERVTPLSDKHRAVIDRLPMRIRDVQAREILAKAGTEPSHCNMILDGFAMRFKRSPEGERQIVAIAVPGDVPDLQSFQFRTRDDSIATMTRARVATISYADLREILTEHPSLNEVFWRFTAIEASILREWVVNVGQRGAVARTAHFLCELRARLETVGRNQGNATPLPLTQAELAGALGMSLVHMNRTLQELRGRKLITLRPGVIESEDWDELASVAHFAPGYLHLDDMR